MLTRLMNILDALSQLVQTIFLPRPKSTSANESVSGRCHWERYYASKHRTWIWAENLIDSILWWDKGPNGEGHCELSDIRDYERAKEKVRRYEGRNKE